MNELSEKYLVNDNDHLRQLRKDVLQGNQACIRLLLSQMALSLNLVMAGAASTAMKHKAEQMLKDINSMKNNKM